MPAEVTDSFWSLLWHAFCGRPRTQTPLEVALAAEVADLREQLEHALQHCKELVSAAAIHGQEIEMLTDLVACYKQQLHAIQAEAAARQAAFTIPRGQ